VVGILDSMRASDVTSTLLEAVVQKRARHVIIDVRPVGDMLMVAVRDDGCGGADPDGGGLAGLARRVRELGGHFALTSPAAQEHRSSRHFHWDSKR
jgi:glucose-6-phosphate-specific signal transduction histidine kinase